MYRSVVRGVGSYLPEKIMTNDDLSQIVDTSDEWIRKRTGIERRHIAADDEFTNDLAVAAAERALAAADMSAADIDLVILATTTPDNTFPATAAKVQARLGVTKGPAFDVQAVCSGFIFAMTQADNMLRLGQAKRALVIGAEIYSRILDWEDRSTCVLFGDGSGAIVLEAVDSEGANNERGVLTTILGTDGANYDKLYVDGGVATSGNAGCVRMAGQDVFRQAVARMSESVEEALEKAELTKDDLDWLVPHQANIRIIEQVGKKLGVSRDKVMITVQEHANTSAATVPLAMTHGVKHGHFKEGDVIALTAMGGGFTWGAIVLRW
ncbi:beta-ketoacyl-ACP synthase III [Curvivirga aplysinae]|uniref:beta-ketoacyl-ACP synthase III n=1 Tax=Curvivirga aplysinae TaxID=2529852 RepID=UPI0012BBD837|nr:beta-ketoacyl-ACP synthase III [Curvivirga aplysinae]MTI09632.1 ketoacyl-ACP synthase III [Curvivirga aplysinae]